MMMRAVAMIEDDELGPVNGECQFKIYCFDKLMRLNALMMEMKIFVCGLSLLLSWFGFYRCVGWRERGGGYVWGEVCHGKAETNCSR